MPSYEDVLRWVNPGHEYHQHRYARGLAEVIVSGCRWLDIGAGTCLHQGWLGPSCEELAARATLLVGCDLVDPFCSYPLLRWWPLTIIEALWIKLINRDPLRFLGTNLFGELEKT